MTRGKNIFDPSFRSGIIFPAIVSTENKPGSDAYDSIAARQIYSTSENNSFSIDCQRAF